MLVQDQVVQGRGEAWTDRLFDDVKVCRDVPRRSPTPPNALAMPIHPPPSVGPADCLQDFYQKECWAHHPKPHQEYIDQRRKQVLTDWGAHQLGGRTPVAKRLHAAGGGCGSPFAFSPLPTLPFLPRAITG